MREGDEIVEPEGAGAALDGMDRTENGIHRFRIAIAVIELEETRFQFRELLLAFLEENLFDFVHIHWMAVPGFQAVTRSMASISLVGSNGLTIQPVAPACRARFFFSASLSVVSTRIGTAR